MADALPLLSHVLAVIDQSDVQTVAQVIHLILAYELLICNELVVMVVRIVDARSVRRIRVVVF